MLKIEDLFMTYGDAKYAELGIFLDLLRALSLLHHTHHWQTMGSQFYGDHLLYQRLYDGFSVIRNRQGCAFTGICWLYNSN